MPEIGEVHRIVQYCRKHLLNKKITKVQALEDPIIYLEPKTGLTAKKLISTLTGRTVIDAKRQGKYFWLELDKSPHLLMHFGMTGWVKFSHDDSGYYKPQRERIAEEKRAQAKAEKEADNEDDQQPLEATADEEWPPRFWKLELQMDGSPKFSAAFVDGRRLGRIRLIDAPAKEMRNTPPLSENGPDPVIDKDIFTAQWLGEKLRSKKKPVKALLLDQANISGIGNWVADEALYQARIHPEQFSNTFSDEQVNKLFDSIVEVCTTACDTLADSSKYPDYWIMRHRWGKGKKGENVLPNGQKMTWITVGGRTSAIVPAVQKKTGPVAGGETDEVDGEEDETVAPKRKRSSKTQVKDEEEDEAAPSRKSGKAAKAVKAESHEEKPAKKSKAATKNHSAADSKEHTSGRRRSTRNR